jgi:hypothetical protein
MAELAVATSRALSFWPRPNNLPSTYALVAASWADVGSVTSVILLLFALIVPVSVGLVHVPPVSVRTVVPVPDVDR